ncbi:MAG: glycosyltransferase family 4 protein [Deltaproteobacteria bacterium]
MNIGLIRMKYTPYGGAEVFLSRFIDELLKRGHKCHIFAAKWDENAGSRVKGQGSSENSKLIWHKIKTFGPSFLRLWLFAINTYFAVRKANLDIILGFDRTFYQDIYRAGDGCHREWLIQRNKSGVRSQESGVRRTTKKIITFLNPLHLTILYLEKRLLKSKRLKFVVANSRRGKDEIIKHYGLPEEKFCVIYNGINIGAFADSDGDKLRAVYREKLNIKNETALLFVGSGFERKGLKFLIEAAGILKREGHNNLKIVVVGKGRIKKYQTIADRCGIGEDIKFMGPVKDINAYYSASDIFVLPSIYEPFSNACLEAMASGLPVVTSRINGASEIIAHGKNGMIVDDPANPKEIAERIKPLLAGRENMLAMGRAARVTAGNYTIEKNVEDFLMLVERAG